VRSAGGRGVLPATGAVSPGSPDLLKRSLWQLREHSCSHIRRELGVAYGTLRRSSGKEIDEEVFGFISDYSEVHLGIDDTASDQDMVHTVDRGKAAPGTWGLKR